MKSIAHEIAYESKSYSRSKEYNLVIKEPFLKRPFDFFLAFFGLLVSFPLLIIIAIAIYIDDRRPIFFKTKVCGRYDISFWQIKFRSMTNPRNGGRHEMVFLVNDPRITRVGRILRKYGLDELPQLINILKGDMSFVGPRPLDRSEGNPRYKCISEIPGYHIRTQARPGMAGLAQIHTDKYVNTRNKLRYDNLYVKKMRLFLDIKLLLLCSLKAFNGELELKQNKCN